ADHLADAAHTVGEVCSFSPDTQVTTAHGLQPISELQVGDRVLAYDQETDTTGYYPVTAVLAHRDPIRVTLTIGGAPIETTPEHPFYTRDCSWVPAGSLWVGAEVWEADGSFGVVQAVVVAAQPQVMYNLTVAEAHTFFVGPEQVLVHNSCVTFDP